MGQDSRWLERLAEFEFALNRPSTRETSQTRWRVISFPMDGRQSAGEACCSDDIVPEYHDGNVSDTGSSTWLNRWSDRELRQRQLKILASVWPWSWSKKEKENQRAKSPVLVLW